MKNRHRHRRQRSCRSWSDKKLGLRTCVGCRNRRSKQQLVRLTANSRGDLIPDPLQRAPGRGVYLCPTWSCVQEACRLSVFAQSLHRKLAPVDPEALASRVIADLQAQMEKMLAGAAQDGRGRHVVTVLALQLRDLQREMNSSPRGGGILK